MTSGAPIIEARGLVKRFGGFTAVAGVDFAVQPGECFGVLGPNGAGKTSTIRMITCMSPVSSGALTVNGLDVMRDQRAVKAILGVVPQLDNLDPDLNVRENLIVYARYFDLSSREAAARAEEVLHLFQLAERAADDVRVLSGGLKRRLVIARALLNRPKVLVLDEPTTGLDPQARRLVWQKVRQLQQGGVTVLLTTHYMEEAAQLCDRLVMMHQGRILAEGAPEQVIARYAGREVAELRLDPAQRAAVKARLAGAPVEIEDAEDALYVFSRNGASLRELLPPGAPPAVRAGTLEDVFLRLTGRGLLE